MSSGSLLLLCLSDIISTNNHRYTGNHGSILTGKTYYYIEECTNIKSLAVYIQKKSFTISPIAMFSQRILKSSTPLLATSAIGVSLFAASFHDASQTQSPPSSAAGERSLQNPSQSPKDPKKTFTSGFSFQNLKLESSEVVNHNTKRLRFELTDKDAVSGLHPSCMFRQSPLTISSTYSVQLHS